ncbi:MAG: C1 family peptidase, partial [Candidatus Krumholzibacteria bacterium]|nr:C1 family peptidase [Candidatus Krumholzibacteria bacterium]
MRPSRWIALVLVAACSISIITAGALFARKPLKAPKPVYVSPAENFGYLPPPVDLTGLRPVTAGVSGQMAPPASWDWRSLGGVTSVKNQNPYGTCWAFAGIGDIESKVLIQESSSNDYSEINVVACNATGTTCNSGGNAWIVANYLSLLGTVNESCNAYPDGCPSPSCVNPACTYFKRITEWRIIPEDETSIKNAIMTYGPVYTGMYASFSGFSTYNGTGCLQYTGTEDQNHGVLIVGWDDTMCGGSGGWIVKNSWGTSWGDDGYFYIKYGSARVGENVSVFTGYKDYDSTETIYYYDDYGWWSSVGYGDGDDWALVAFTPTGLPSEGSLLKAVDIWATWAPTSYSIEIYDEFDGTTPTSRLVGPMTGTKTEAGYYSVALPTPLVVYSNDPIYIVVEFNTPGYDYPIPFDDSGPMETNKSYLSDTGISGSWEALDAGNYEYGDIAVRARVEPKPTEAPCSWEGDPLWYYCFGWYEGYATSQPAGHFDYDIYAGQSQEWVIYWGNVTWEGTCMANDTFCWTAESKGGWTLDLWGQNNPNVPGICNY